jgi:hypothetical protein
MLHLRVNTGVISFYGSRPDGKQSASTGQVSNVGTGFAVIHQQRF